MRSRVNYISRSRSLLRSKHSKLPTISTTFCLFTRKTEMTGNPPPPHPQFFFELYWNAVLLGNVIIVCLLKGTKIGLHNGPDFPFTPRLFSKFNKQWNLYHEIDWTVDGCTDDAKPKLQNHFLSCWLLGFSGMFRLLSEHIICLSIQSFVFTLNHLRMTYYKPFVNVCVEFLLYTNRYATEQPTVRY